MESFETLVIEGGREVDCRFYVDKEQVLLKHLTAFFEAPPKFAVLVLGPRSYYVELVGDRKGLAFDGYGGLLTRVQKSVILRGAAALHP